MQAGDKALLKGEIVTIMNIGEKSAMIKKQNGTITVTPTDALTIYKEVTAIIKGIRFIINFVKSLFKKK